MTRLRLTLHLAGRDLSRRATESALLFVALAVAATTFTIGLVLHGQTAAPYAGTRRATAGPDIVATLFPPTGRAVTPTDMARLAALTRLPEVAAASRGFPTTWSPITAGRTTGVAQVQGRDTTMGAVDRPLVVSGQWVKGNGVVVERAFAQAMGIGVADTVELGGRPTPVVGIAVSAALPPYPQLCTIGCILDRGDWMSAEPGLVWATRAHAAALRTPREPFVWFRYFRLHDPAQAPAFASRLPNDGPPTGRPDLTAWQDIARRQAEQLTSERTVVVFGSTLLVVLALATLVVLVGGRMLDEVRRVGALKAVGATPGFVTRLLLATYLAVGLVAAVAGLCMGRWLAPQLVTTSAGLLGRPGATTVSLTDVLVVIGSTLGVVVLATALPAWRAARTSTVRALADAGRAPRRSRIVVRLSARLPAPTLLGLRLFARRPRRAILTTLSVAVAVCGTVVVLYAQSSLHAERGAAAGSPADPQTAQLHVVMTALTVLLTVMAAVNLVFVTRASAIDARQVLAVARTLGTSPAEATSALGIAQLVPALGGLVLGGATGIVLFHVLSSSPPTAPPAAELLLIALATVVLVVVLTALPARWEARRPIAVTLREP
jgi:putative ABC transport system permease protein